MSYPPAKWGLIESVKKIATDDFFDAIEVTHVANDGEREKLRNLIQEAHLSVCFGAQPCLLGTGANPNHIEEAKREEAEKILKDAVDEAQYLGAKAIAFLAGNGRKRQKILPFPNW